MTAYEEVVDFVKKMRPYIDDIVLITSNYNIPLPVEHLTVRLYFLTSGLFKEAFEIAPRNTSGCSFHFYSEHECFEWKIKKLPDWVKEGPWNEHVSTYWMMRGLCDARFKREFGV